MKKQLLFNILCLLWSQYAISQTNEQITWVVFGFYQTDTSTAILQVERNDSILSTLHLTTQSSKRSPIVVDKRTVGNCQLSNWQADTLALTINFLQEDPIYAQLSIEKLPYTHLKFFNQRDDTTRWQPVDFPKYTQQKNRRIKTDRSAGALKKIRLKNANDNFRFGIAIYRDETDRFSGLIDQEGNIKQPAIYSNIWEFAKNWGLEHNEKIALTDTNAQLITPFIYKGISSFGKDNIIVALPSDSVAIINSSGKIINTFAPNTGIHSYTTNEDNYIICNEKGYCGLLNEQGNIVVPLIYTRMEWYNSQWLKVRKDGSWCGIIDIYGNEVIPIKYNEIIPQNTETTMDDALLSVQYNNLWGLLRLNNTFLVQPRYQSPLISIGKYWHYYDTNNHTIVIDSIGQEILSLPYYLPWGYTPPYTQVASNGKYGYVDAKGKEIIPCVLDNWLSFYCANDGGGLLKTTRTLAIKNRKCGIVDEKGNFIIPTIYDQILPRNADLTSSPLNYEVDYYAVSINNKAGVINSKGQVIIPLEYDAVSFACNNLVRLYKERDKKCGWANTSGKIYAQPRLPTQTCQYSEPKLVTYATQTGCENTRGNRHPCDPTPLPCFQCAQECPDEKWLQQLSLGKQ